MTSFDDARQTGSNRMPPREAMEPAEPELRETEGRWPAGEAAPQGGPTEAATQAIGVPASAGQPTPAAPETASVDDPTRSIGRPSAPPNLPDLGAVNQERIEYQRQRENAVVAAAVGASTVPAGERRPVGSGKATVRREGPGMARLVLRRVEPMSVLKMALAVNIALFLVWMVAVGIVYTALTALGVFDTINSTYSELTNLSANSPAFGTLEVFTFAGVVGVLNIVLFSVLATLVAYIYNACAALVGGIEVELQE